MSGFLYGVALQWKLDIRSKSLLVTCYIVPLIFFLLMGGIFTSVMPEMRSALIQSMIVMGVLMGAFIGLPPFPEVVDYIENGDGTLTLFVDGVWPDYNSDYAFTNQIVVRPLGNGAFRYLSNTIQKQEMDIPVVGNR